MWPDNVTEKDNEANAGSNPVASSIRNHMFFEDVELVRETELAYLAIFWDYEDKDFWVPKSQIFPAYMDEGLELGYRGNVYIKDWFGRLIIGKITDKEHPTPKARFHYKDYTGR
jgi:hypothetical protein